MLDLALSVLCSTLIFIVFKLFATYKVQTLYAIITNYVVAGMLGIMINPEPLNIQEIVHKSWFMETAILGVFFIIVFNIMAKSSQVNGVGVTSVATKMSLVVPVVFALMVYKERLSFLQFIGIALALIAVYLATIKKKEVSVSKRDFWLPVLVFLGSGVIDTSIKYIQETHLGNEEFPLFSSTVFGAAALSGIVFMVLQIKRSPLKVNFKNVLGGVFLGVPNYFSIYYLLRALKSDVLNSSSIFTLNNVSIVLFTTLLGVILFQERLSPKNWLGVGFAVVSIVLVALF